MSRAVLSIGSNLGDRLGHLQSVLDLLGPRAVAVSAVYETAPWGPVPQGDYLNAVVLAEDARLDAWGWLDVARAAERAAGRERSVRWGPRTLDVDVVEVSEGGHAVLSSDPELTLPHPRAYERGFVLVPWADVDPSVADRVGALAPQERAGVRATTHALRLRSSSPRKPALP